MFALSSLLKSLSVWVREALYKVAVDWRYIAIPRQLSVFNLPFQTYLIFSEFNWLPCRFLSLSSRVFLFTFSCSMDSKNYILSCRIVTSIFEDEESRIEPPAHPGNKVITRSYLNSKSCLFIAYLDLRTHEQYSINSQNHGCWMYKAVKLGNS
jgi:hypothetical protein